MIFFFFFFTLFSRLFFLLMNENIGGFNIILPNRFQIITGVLICLMKTKQAYFRTGFRLKLFRVYFSGPTIKSYEFLVVDSFDHYFYHYEKLPDVLDY